MDSKLFRRIILAVLAANVAAGCILFTSPKDRAMRRSPSFKEGYADGCAAASASGSNFREGPVRDEALYKSDRVYRAGWANGYQTCRPARSDMSTTPETSPIPQPVPSH